MFGRCSFVLLEICRSLVGHPGDMVIVGMSRPAVRLILGLSALWRANRKDVPAVIEALARWGRK